MELRTGFVLPKLVALSTCVFITALEREAIRNFVRIASSASPLPRLAVYSEAQGSGVDTGHEVVTARGEEGLREGREEPVSGSAGSLSARPGARLGGPSLALPGLSAGCCFIPPGPGYSSRL